MMFKPYFVVTAAVLLVGLGLYESASQALPHPTGPPPPPTPHEYTGTSSKDKPSMDAPPPPAPADGTGPSNAVEAPPDIPKHDVAGQGDTKISTTALTVFAGNIDKLATSLMTSWTEMGTVQPVAAGAFPSGVLIAKNTGTLSADTTTALNNMITALHDLRDAMTKIATDYKTTEEAVKITTDKLNTYMTDVTRFTSAANADSH